MVFPQFSGGETVNKAKALNLSAALIAAGIDVKIVADSKGTNFTLNLGDYVPRIARVIDLVRDHGLDPYSRIGVYSNGVTVK